MKFNILFLLLFLSTFLSGQNDFELIRPIVESETMNERQALIYSESVVFRNWAIEKFQLDSIMKSYSGEGVKVCICDTGKPDHIKIKNNIKGSKNFTTDMNVNDGNGHSTHVAGIIVEIAPDVELYIAKVLSDAGFSSNEGVANGMKWCADQGANFINMSLGGSQPSSTIKDAIDYVTSKGVSIIAAAGNAGQSETKNTMGYPARYDEAIAVGSINEQLAVSVFSSSGEEGDLVAGGERILSTWKNNTFRVLSGTSMSTPFVSGVAALYYEKHQSNTAIERLLELGSKDMLPEGFDRYSFWGHVEPLILFDFKTPPETPVDNPKFKISFGWQFWLFIGVVAAAIIFFFVYHRRNKFNNIKTEEDETK